MIDFLVNSVDTITILLGTFLFGIITVYFINRGSKPNKNLPPGPFGLPIIGHIDFNNQPQHVYFEKLRQTYGPIFGLQIGIRYVVVVADYDLMKEMGNMENFVPRPPDIFEMSKDYTHISDMSGVEWKQHRRLLLKSLRSVGMGTTKGEIAIQSQIERFLEGIKNLIKTNSKVPIRQHIIPAVKNIIFTMICCETFEDSPKESESVFKFMDKMMEYIFQKASHFYYPWRKLFHYFSSERVYIESLQADFEQIVRKEIKKHMENPEPEQSDYIDFYIQEMTQNPGLKTFSESTLLGNSEIMLMAGSDTIRITIEWSLKLLADYKTLQEKVHKEIVDLIGRDRRANWNDRNQLPLTQAFILEVMRYKDIIPVNDPRWTEEDTMIKDYLIPKHTVVLFGFHSVHRDKLFWGDPENFRPERFLTSSRKEIESRLAERVVSFSMGKRSCPGERLAVVQIFLYLSAIVQNFKLSPVEGEKQPEKLHFAPELHDPHICFAFRE